MTVETTLEMLWETTDPAEVLSSRFGFHDPATAVGWVADALSSLWGIEVDACERIVLSDHNALAWVSTPAGRMVLKWSVAPVRFARLQALSQLIARLAANGLPVSAPVPALDGRLQVRLGAASMCLQRHIDGPLLDTTRLAQVRDAGEVLRRLHRALAQDPGQSGPSRSTRRRPCPTRSTAGSTPNRLMSARRTGSCCVGSPARRSPTRCPDSWSTATTAPPT